MELNAFHNGKSLKSSFYTSLGKYSKLSNCYMWLASKSVDTREKLAAIILKKFYREFLVEMVHPTINQKSALNNKIFRPKSFSCVCNLYHKKVAVAQWNKISKAAFFCFFL